MSARPKRGNRQQILPNASFGALYVSEQIRAEGGKDIRKRSEPSKGGKSFNSIGSFPVRRNSPRIESAPTDAYSSFNLTRLNRVISPPSIVTQMAADKRSSMCTPVAAKTGTGLVEVTGAGAAGGVPLTP